MIRALAVLVLAAAPALAQEGVSGTATAYDADSLTIAGTERVRLLGLDAAEMRPLEPGAEEARDLVRHLIAGRIVTCITRPPPAPQRDRYGRMLAYCSVDGDDIGYELVVRGLAYACVSGRMGDATYEGVAPEPVGLLPRKAWCRP